MMTEDLMGPPRMYALTPWVRRLLVANLIVFLFQVTLFTLQGSVSTFGFVPLLAAQRPWTFLTYMFLHGSALHLAFNLIALFMFGGPVEDRFGSRSFIGFYLLCGLGGALLSLLLTQESPFAILSSARRARFTACWSRLRGIGLTPPSTCSPSQCRSRRNGSSHSRSPSHCSWHCRASAAGMTA